MGLQVLTLQHTREVVEEEQDMLPLCVFCLLVFSVREHSDVLVMSQ
jgi:hypothetical protein